MEPWGPACHLEAPRLEGLFALFYPGGRTQPRTPWDLLSLSHRLYPQTQPQALNLFFKPPQDKEVPPNKQKGKTESETCLRLRLRRVCPDYGTGAFISLLTCFAEIGRREVELFRPDCKIMPPAQVCLLHPLRLPNNLLEHLQCSSLVAFSSINPLSSQPWETGISLILQKRKLRLREVIC